MPALFRRGPNLLTDQNNRRSTAQYTGFALVGISYVVIMILLMRTIGRVLLYFTQDGSGDTVLFLLQELGVLLLVIAVATLAIRKGFALIRQSLK